MAGQGHGLRLELTRVGSKERLEATNPMDSKLEIYRRTEAPLGMHQDR